MRNCKGCGSPFTPTAKHPNTVYCSRECSAFAMGTRERTRLPLIPCTACRESFQPLRRTQRFCSLACAQKLRPKQAPRLPAERFWERVQKSDGCWLWTGPFNPKGYGTFHPRKGQTILAHRYAWFLKHGALPTACVLHTCDTPACCRPSHFFEGTREDNNADMRNKLRHAFGARNGNAKLTESDVEQIRKLLSQGVPVGRIAKQFGVSHSNISMIRSNKTWQQKAA